MFNSGADSPFSRRKILLVEDDEVALTMYASALRMEGFQVRTAPDGLTALRVAESFAPDVVILDLRLPMASGFDVLHDLRATSLRMPVIAVSGHDPGIEAAQRDPGFFAALRKPFDPNELVTVTRRALQHGTASPT
jgi:two-component system, OmpR family, response regulator